jgi:hypothetical protein
MDCKIAIWSFENIKQTTRLNHSFLAYVIVLLELTGMLKPVPYRISNIQYIYLILRTVECSSTNDSPGELRVPNLLVHMWVPYRNTTINT